jgi:radical SAM protein with 4Fe4S-binding SPASM domain
VKLHIDGYISPIQYDNGFPTNSYRDFSYNTETDSYTCQYEKILVFTHLQLKENEKYYKVYSAKTEDCKVCPFRENCFGRTAKRRTIARPIAHELLEANLQRARTHEYKMVQKLRRIMVRGFVRNIEIKT